MWDVVAYVDGTRLPLWDVVTHVGCGDSCGMWRLCRVVVVQWNTVASLE
jgi:hypothetical protein